MLWAAWVGAALKWVLNEGIARWQLATGTTLLEGWAARLGRWIQWAFIAYLLPWSFFTAGALISACGVAGTGILPLGPDLSTSKILWGTIHSIAGAGLVWLGGFRLFERLMAGCIALMFFTVVLSALLLGNDWAALGAGLVAPRIPPGGLGYTLGVLGGVGGTVTLLSYGYWIREKGRTGPEGIRICRIDLGAAYAMTAVFGLAMIVIGSRVEFRQGPLAALELADALGTALGAAGKWVFLVGFWAAVFSSLLGVWQSTPYFFADFLRIARRRGAGGDLAATAPYRAYLALIAVVPLPLLWVPLERAQLMYAVFGAFFMPLLALTLLLMNTRSDWVGSALRNRWPTNAALVATLGFFLFVGLREAAEAVQEAR